MDDAPIVKLAAPQPWYVLPLMGLVGECVFIVGLVLSYKMDNPTLFNVALTAAIMQSGAVINFFFGSSLGSAKKDDANVAAAIKKEETTAVMASALATSTPAPPVAMAATVDPGQPVMATTSEPARQPPKAESGL